MTPEQKCKIDSMPYIQMLRLNRFAPSCEPLFKDDVGEYFVRIMIEKRKIIGDAEHTRISKEIGW